MPVFHNLNPEQTVLEFGTGDIIMKFHQDDKQERVAIAFYNISDTVEIGKMLPVDSVKTDGPPSVVLSFPQFGNTKSIDALIMCLNHLKREFVIKTNIEQE